MRQGLYLGLVGHVFLYLIAANREWSLPPWPIFGALAVMTLGDERGVAADAHAGAARRGCRRRGLVVIAVGRRGRLAVWGLTVVLAAAAVSAYALAWIRLAAVVRRRAAAGSSWAARAAAVVLFVG